MDLLLEEVEVVATRGRLDDAEVTSIEYDSRRVGPGALFCCLPGSEHDGHVYAAEATASGAVGLLVERVQGLEVAQAVVPRGQARRAMAQASATFYGEPATALTTIGVTGANGKTTVTHMLRAILERNGMPTLVVGTLGGARTTPEAPVLQRLLARARDEGRRAAAVEVSSHALSQERIGGIRFDAAVFTNLGRDHLDHHGTMEDYFAAKASLFTPERASVGVVRVDDAWGRRLAEEASVEVVPFSLSDASEVEADVTSTAFTWRARRVRLAMPGLFQVANALAAATTASVLGVPDDTVAQGLQDARTVDGRFEVVELSAPFTVVVDYAHTPEGLQTALASARAVVRDGRVLVVFGAGGDRDHSKRPAMGAAAAAGADFVVVTSDNPRSEDPRSIAADVVSGVSGPVELAQVPDRAEAIELAMGRARPGDLVLIAGKGHEREIETAHGRRAFDDREAARAAWERLRAAHPEEGEA